VEPLVIAQEAPGTQYESSLYFALRYMNPFDFWLPLPLIRVDSESNFSLDGAGLISVIMDPTDRHLIMFSVFADINYQMAMISPAFPFIWQTTVPGFPVMMQFSDTVITDNSIPYRATRVNLSASFFKTPGRWLYGLSLGGGYYRFAKDDGGASAYDWSKTESGFYYSAGLAFSNHTRLSNELYGTGMSLSFRGVSITESFQPRFEGRFQASMETKFPVSLVLYGAYDERGVNIHGVSRTYGDSLFQDSASVEYFIHRDLDNLLWLGGAEASLGLFSFEIQSNLSHFYFNRFFGALSLRNVLYDSGGHQQAEGIEIGDFHLAQSLVLKLGLVSSIIPLKYVPFFIEPNIWGAWKFSNTITGKGEAWNFGIGLSVRY
jgi:hypothetical protein